MASCDASFSVPPSKGGSNDQTKNTDQELNKIRQAHHELKVKVASNNIQIKALEQSEIKAREFKDKLAGRVKKRNYD